MKLKLNLWERITGKSRKFDVIKLRKEICYLMSFWAKINIDLLTKDFISNKSTTLTYNHHKDNLERINKIFFTSLDEVSMCRDKGINAVYERLKSDRDFIVEFYGKIDLEKPQELYKEYKNKERQQKLKRILK
jgi:hypothetical protein